jgi:calcineurin-like phosphoesterase family protein
MNKTWLVADWHLGESRFELMGRPFTTVDEHVQTLIDNHNAVVKPDDRVIVVGDVCYQKTPEFLKYVWAFNGRKTLVRGNHDRVLTDEQLQPYFEHIVAEGEGIEYIHNYTEDGKEKSLPCYITHYPSYGVGNMFNLVGHIHSAWKYQLNMMNIGVDVNHFRPVDMDRIPFHFKAITEFYDEDVWVAYCETNSAYLGKRGKKGTYFTKS